MKDSRAFKELVMYEHGDFLIEIRVTHKTYEAWLQHKDCGIMELLFGCPKEQEYGLLTYSQFKEMVEKNLDEYIETYREEYMA